METHAKALRREGPGSVQLFQMVPLKKKKGPPVIITIIVVFTFFQGLGHKGSKTTMGESR